MSKIWRVPIHHEFIAGLNINQILFYSGLVFQDKKEEFENNRDLLEYLASFIDPKAVEEIKRKRGSTSDHSVSKEDFDAQLKDKSFLSEDILRVIGQNKHTNLNSKVDTVRKPTGDTVRKLIED